MDYRKINSHIILILLVGTVVFLIAALVRRAAIESVMDAGTANLVFIGFIAVCAVVYLIILSSLANAVIPWIMKRLPIRRKPHTEPAEEEDYTETYDVYDDTPLFEDNDESEEIAEDTPKQPRPAVSNWKEIREKEIQAKFSLFIEYAQYILGPYSTENELVRLGRFIELYAHNAELPHDIDPIKPERLTNPDLFHFGWNMAHYFGYKKEEVVPWLQKVFVRLDELSYSTIKGKLHDYQTHKYIIPNIDDIPKYMAEKKA